MEIPGGGGSNVKPSEMENPRGWGVKLEKTLRGGGYGYFLEPHNLYIFEYKEITSDADDDLNEEPVIKKRRKRVSG